MLAAVAVVGLVVASSIRLIWFVMLVFAFSAVPQALAALRLEARRKRGSNEH